MDTSIDGVELEGKHVIIGERAMGAAYRDVTWRTVLAKGGFGCSPGLRGKAVFVEHVRDGDTGRFERYEIERLATPEEVAEAKAAGEPGAGDLRENADGTDWAV